MTVVPLGWRVGGALFLKQEDRSRPQTASMIRSWETLPGRAPSSLQDLEDGPRPPTGRRDVEAELPLTPGHLWAIARHKIDGTAAFFVGSIQRITRYGLNQRELAYCAFGGLWTLLVCAWLGGAISAIETTPAPSGATSGSADS